MNALRGDCRRQTQRVGVHGDATTDEGRRVLLVAARRLLGVHHRPRGPPTPRRSRLPKARALIARPRVRIFFREMELHRKSARGKNQTIRLIRVVVPLVRRPAESVPPLLGEFFFVFFDL